MIPAMTTVTTVTTATLAFAVIASSTLTARAVSEQVRAACREDYLAHCSEHELGGTSVRRCMSAHGSRLSPECIEAVIAAGEVSRAEVQRRKRQAADR